MSVSIEIDLRKFSEALNFVYNVTHKDGPALVNKYALQTIIGSKGVKGAAAMTPKATKEAIKAVPIRQIARAVMGRAKRRNEKLTRAERDKRIKAEYARRIKAIGYTAFAGWNNAAMQLGGRGFGNRKEILPQFERSEAARGYAAPAGGEDLSALIVNTAPAADKIGREALQAALDGQAADMTAYATRKLQQTCDRA